MQELADALTQTADDWSLSLADTHRGLLQHAAEKWASAALRDLRGEHLKAALEISRALVEFLAVEERVREP